MSFVRPLFRDLVDKRLWPIALVLLIALVAIPLIGARSGSSKAADEAPPVTPATNAPGSPAVELIGPASDSKRHGTVIDPFRRPAKPADPSSTAPTAASASGSSAAASGPSSSASSAGSSSSSTSAPKSGATSSGSTVDQAGPSAYDLTKVAEVRFGRRGTTLKHIANLAPLSSLPSEKDGIVLFSGALKKRDVARFFITATAGKTTGSGTCKIRQDKCVSVDMQVGDQQLFRVDGVEYELDLVAINAVKHASSRTMVRFGSLQAGERSIARLKPLGGGSDPALLYLGVYNDAKRALFLLGPDATGRSTGDCMDGSACRVFGLRSGEAGGVQVTRADGSVKRYSIYVSSVGGATISGGVANDGRATLRAMIRDHATAGALSGFRYARTRGVVMRAPSA